MLNVKPFRQRTGFCGPATLKMVLAFYGVEKTEAELATLTGTNDEVAAEGDKLLEVAKSFGLKGFVKDFAELSDIKEYVMNKQIPVIVDWFYKDDGHYSVVVDVNDETILLQDPYLGYVRSLKPDTFYRIWFDFIGNFLKSKDDLFIRRMIVIHK